MVTDHGISAEALANLAQRVDRNLADSTEQIRTINDDIHVLSINAKIEAARAGNQGKGFGVVADHIRLLVSRTNAVTEQMESQVKSLMQDLSRMSMLLGSAVRGQRLQQVALNAIDIIDRNLYERSCDVRWWATDASVVQALENPSAESAAHASHRLGVILDSYTVYVDLILADTTGQVLANGRPGQFTSVGTSVAREEWFRAGVATATGDDFAEQAVHPSPLVNGEPVLAYATTVRRNGNPTGEVLGVLGILFRWQELGVTAANRAVQAIRDSDGQDLPLAGYIADAEGTILAASTGAPLHDALPPALHQFAGTTHRESPGGNGEVTVGNAQYLAGWARSPGYETYRTGWRCLMVLKK